MHMFSRPAMMVVHGVVALFLGGGVWFLQAHRSDLRQEIRSDLLAIAQFKVAEIEGWRRERRADAAVLAEDDAFAAHVNRLLAGRDADSRRYLLARFDSLRAHYGYSDVLLLNREGDVLLSHGEIHRQPGGEALRALQQSFENGKPVMLDLHVGDIDKRPHTSVVAPIRTAAGDDAGNEFICGVVLVSDARQFLFPLIQSWPTRSRTAESLLVRREGDHVLFLNELRHQEDTALEFRLPLTRTDLPAVKAVQGRKGWVQGRDYRGRKVLAVVKPVSESDWFLVAKIDAGEALSLLRWESALILVALGGVGALLWVGTVLVIQRRETDHFEALYQAECMQRQAEERDSIILESIGDAVIATDGAGHIAKMNAVAEQVTGWTVGEALGKPAAEVFRIISETTREPVPSPVDRVFEEGIVVGLANHTLLLRRDGAEVPIADSGAPIRAPDGQVAGVVLVFRDQTEERRAQARERHLRQVLLGIRNVNQLIVKEDDPHRIVERACEHLTETFGYLSAWIALIDPVDGTVKHVAGAGLGGGLAELREHSAEGKALPACAVASIEEPHRLHVFNEPARECSECPVGHMRGEHTVLGRALYAGDHALGVLCVSVPREFGQDRESRQLFQEVTDDLAFALHKAEVAESLRRTETQYRTLFETAPVGVFRTCSTGEVLHCNPTMARLVGAKSPEDAMSRYTNLGEELYLRPERRREFINDLKRDGNVENFEYEAKTLDGREIWLSMSAHIADRKPDGTFTIDGFTTDVTRRKHAEQERDQVYAELAQAERLNAVGRLAGGVAHDFNNLLMGIMSYVELCRDALDEDSRLHEWLDQVTHDAQRSADLIRQLLAFARKQNITPEVVDLNDAVSGMLKMMRRLIGEDIELLWRPGAQVAPVYLDPSQLDQILANLTVNARDAIGGVGRVTVETRNVAFDERYCEEHPGFVPGDYAMLAVNDDGCGMDQKTMDQVFEPFFTTKPTGEGTGLGLATVYGIVKQNEGFINVYSEPGKGTSFHIYLPRHRGVAKPDTRDEQPPLVVGGSETILLVEDELAVRKTASIFLERLGYAVIPAATPEAALQQIGEGGVHVDVLLTDVVMPGMNGRDLAAKLTEQFPGLKCLYMSGYTANVIAHRGILEKDMHFLGKPFTRAELARKVREVLGA